MTKEEALSKLQKYCAYQDRCHKEVRTKLLDIGVRGYDLEWVIAELISEKFLDEERFARSFVRGKYRMKKWGRVKIRIELKKRQISDYCIRKGLSEIDQEEYEHNLRELLKKKLDTLSGNSYQKKSKLAQFVIRKGYESDITWQEINKLELD
ncbi:MAG: regulatory protein RecX [Bacteroidota bacterium]